MTSASERPPDNTPPAARAVHLTGWGRGQPMATRLARPSHPDDAIAFLAGSDAPLIARGAGRSYGDSAVGPGYTLDMRRCDRLLDYDARSRVVTAEAGLRLIDLIAFALPRGAFPPVVPGTGEVTLGGMIAADVHGKNHHRAGSLRRHLKWIDLLGADGQVRRLGPETEGFRRCTGGMGLTGVILRAALQLIPVETGYLRQTVTAAPDLAGLLACIRAVERHEHVVAWIDLIAEGSACGRGYVIAADSLTRADLPPGLAANPFALPAPAPAVVPRWIPPLPPPFRAAMRLVNARHLRGVTRHLGPKIVPWPRFFFPLDRLGNWNRLLGRRGFAQVHLLLPEKQAETTILALVAMLSKHRLCPTLAVVKRMAADPGAESLAFADAGVALAVDLPRGPRLAPAARDINALVAAAGGRFYLAKDSLLDGAELRLTDPRAADFAAWRRDCGLNVRFVSGQSERLGL